MLVECAQHEHLRRERADSAGWEVDHGDDERALELVAGVVRDLGRGALAPRARGRSRSSASRPGRAPRESRRRRRRGRRACRRPGSGRCRSRASGDPLNSAAGQGMGGRAGRRPGRRCPCCSRRPGPVGPHRRGRSRSGEGRDAGRRSSGRRPSGAALRSPGAGVGWVVPVLGAGVPVVVVIS